MTTLKVGLCALLMMAGAQARADVRLPKILTDHMVMQRGVPVHVWGWADVGEAVTVSLEKDVAKATTDKAGRWSVTLPARPAGGPYKITVAGKNTVELNDVLMGDVWLASGQSNMEMPLKGFNPQMQVKDHEAEIAAANYPQIRLLHVHTDASEYPTDDLKSAVIGWQACSPATVPTFSAAAYFFGREIYEKEKVPIGLIDSAWGGTPAEAWASLDALGHSSVIDKVMQQRAVYVDTYGQYLEQKTLEDAAAKAAGQPLPKHATDHLVSWEPSAIYNAMIAPLTPLPVKGVIWYQGESNTDSGRAGWYEPLFETMITDWRAKWKMPEMPFLFVQIASFGSSAGYPEVRDAQRRTLKLKNTGMAVAIDVGEEKNIHPAQKQVVGHRLALNAEAIAYGETVVHAGPLFKSATADGGAMKVSFDSAVGLKAVGGPLGGFEIAGADGVFSKGDAKIVGDSVVVSSASVTKPAFVRYAWSGWVVGANLYNGADLPASPFTSQSLATP